MRDKEQSPPNHFNTTGQEILFGPFIEQLTPLLKRLPEKMKTLMKWLSFATSPKVVLLLLLIFILCIWGSYISCRPPFDTNKPFLLVFLLG